MSGDVSGNGTVIHLGDGEHRVRLPIRSMIEIERHFEEGIQGCILGLRNRTVETSFIVLSEAIIDGEHWESERIEDAMEDVSKMDLGLELMDLVMTRMSYSSSDDKPSDATSTSKAGQSPKAKAASRSTGRRS